MDPESLTEIELPEFVTSTCVAGAAVIGETV
jgi:hypothetical protein